VLFIAINIDEGSSLKNKKNGNQLFFTVKLVKITPSAVLPACRIPL